MGLLIWGLKLSRMSLAFTGIFTFLVAVYPQYAASALAGNGFMYNKLGCDWATSLLAFLTVATMPLPLLFFHYGKILRAKSRFATST
ncbi:bicyclomycin resistance protein [Penicillium capsulatum]|uniref:Bicyclomycin resistance protein n=1 Tax=Penicillium capsulatum TaxID=69766 RepID=A0A9W9IRM2_9EURO|nr:bicyclomycin resistance protein [Penicillium capsulatum]